MLGEEGEKAKVEKVRKGMMLEKGVLGREVGSKEGEVRNIGGMDEGRGRNGGKGDNWKD